jgi:uncharacterized membrane protein
MAFCAKCGTEVGSGAAFCPKCGAPQAVAAGPVPPPASAPTPVVTSEPLVGGGTGLAENIAGLLCYVLGWVTGIIFFLIDKRPFVRFHAAQSIVVFGGLHVILILLGHFVGFGFFGGWGWNGGSWGLIVLLYELINLVSFILWILLMIKAAQHEKFRVPIAAEFADQLAGK